MALIDFIENKGRILISVIIVVGFSISSSIWIITSSNVSNFGKVLYIIYMVIFSLLQYFLPVLFKLQRLLRKKSGKTPYSEGDLEKQKNFSIYFIFFYTILLFLLSLGMDFLEFNSQSYFIIKPIFVISSNFIVGFFLYAIEIKYKKTIFIIAIITLNLIAILGLFM